MNHQKMLRALKYRFRSVFIDPPSTNEELFCNLKHCISLFDSEWVQQIKPSSTEKIQALEQMVEQDFGKKLPPCYKLYLQEMGADDGELLLQHIADLNYYLWGYEIEEFLRHFDKGDMAESPQKCIEMLMNRNFADKRMLSFLWYLFPEELSASNGFAFTLNEENPDEIIFSSTFARPICCDTFPKQLAYCEYLKVIHWIEDHGEAMKRRKWNSFSFSDSDSIFSARFRAYCPTEWMEEEEAQFSCYVSFLEKIEARFYLEEAWFSRQKTFPDREISCSDYDHTFFSRYIAFSTMSDLTLLIEWHSGTYDPYYRPNDRPFIQVHMLGKEVAEMNEIIHTILEDTTLLETEKDESRLFAKMDLE